MVTSWLNVLILSRSSTALSYRNKHILDREKLENCMFQGGWQQFPPFVNFSTLMEQYFPKQVAGLFQNIVKLVLSGQPWGWSVHLVEGACLKQVPIEQEVS